eukprot:jgi/Ulvmu1/2807/UM142_0005.1
MVDSAHEATTAQGGRNAATLSTSMRAPDHRNSSANVSAHSGLEIVSETSTRDQQTPQLLLTDHTQCLRLETITDTESRRAIFALKLAILVGVLGLIALTVIKESSKAQKWLVLNRTFVIVQVASNAVLLTTLLSVFSIWTWRLVQSYRRGMTWSKRRVGAVQNATVRGLLITTIIAGQLTMNTVLLADPSTFCKSRYVQPLVDAVVWVCWATVLVILVAESHGTNLVRRPDRPDGAVWDEPVTMHWPKLFIWVPVIATVVWVTAMGIDDGRTFQVRLPDGEACTWGVHARCAVSPALRAAIIVVLPGTVACFVLYAFYLLRAWRQLSGELYQKYRVMNMVVRLQFRYNGGIVLMLLVGVTLSWFVGTNTCVNYALTWFGAPPVTFTIVCLQMVSFNLSFPRSHDFLAMQHTLPAALLQQFAWTEADMPRRRAKRREAVAPGTAISADLSRAPMFCFETAIKLFFWSVIIYSYAEVAGAEGVSLAAMPAPIREILGEMDAAMRLFGLRKRRLFYDRACGTKALLAWSDSIILLTFRGTKEMVNFVQDANFLQIPHPPLRKYKGRTPCVHKGFLTTWRAHSVHAAVLSLVREILDGAPNPGAVRVLCTGHSLGGAVAQLASIDIVRSLDLPPERVAVYTFGCPRIGNHALAEEVEELVPDTWHVINDQDVVTRGMKLLGVYKRAGHRVIINRRGDLIVRPSHFEASMLQNWLPHSGAAADHGTVSYQNALVAIILAQLQDSSRHADGLHGLLGLLKQLPQVRLALESHARKMGTSFANLVHGLAAHARHAQGSVRSAGSAAAAPGPDFSSQRFTPSRHASLLRAAGALHGDADAVDSAGLPFPPGSPASTAADSATSAEVAVVVIDGAACSMAQNAQHGFEGSPDDADGQQAGRQCRADC